MRYPLLSLLARRIIPAFRSWPTPPQWRDTALLAAAYALVGIPLGLLTGRLTLEWSSAPLGQILAFVLIAILAPSLVEELCFRVALIPRNSEPVSQAGRGVWAGASLVLFVAWHPLNAWLLNPWARPIFFDPIFLVLAALLGLTCTLAYLRTGSIWPPVMIHWLTVIVWKLCLGERIFILGS